MQSLKEKSVNAVLWNAIERFSVQGVNFVISLVIARLVSPEDFGAIAMLAIFLGIANTFVDGGFANALVRKLDRTEVDNSTAFHFNVVVGAVAYLTLFFAAPSIASFYSMPILIPVLRVVALSIAFNSMAIVQQAILTAEINFKSQAKISLIAAGASGIMGVVMAYVGWGVWALVAQMLGSSLIRMALLWSIVRWKPLRVFSLQSFREIFGYGSKLLLSNLVVNISGGITGLIIGRKFSAGNLGYYNRAEQLTYFLANNISAILQRATFPVLSKKQDDVAALRHYYLKIITITSMLVIPAMAVLGVFAEPIVITLLTDKWVSIVPLMQILVFNAVWIPFSALNINIICVVGHSDYVLRIELLKGILRIVAILLSMPYGLPCVCVALAVVSFFCSFIYTGHTKHSVGVNWWQQTKCMIPYMLMSAVAALIGYVVSCITTIAVVKLFVGIISFVGVYFLLLLYLDRENVRFVKSLIPHSRNN